MKWEKNSLLLIRRPSCLIACMLTCVWLCQSSCLWTHWSFRSIPSALPVVMVSITTVDSCCLVNKSCLILCNPMDCSLPGSCVHGISQARILDWVAISFSRGSSQPWNRTLISYIAPGIVCLPGTAVNTVHTYHTQRVYSVFNSHNSLTRQLLPAWEKWCLEIMQIIQSHQPGSLPGLPSSSDFLDVLA